LRSNILARIFLQQFLAHTKTCLWIELLFRQIETILAIQVTQRAAWFHHHLERWWYLDSGAILFAWVPFILTQRVHGSLTLLPRPGVCAHMRCSSLISPSAGRPRRSNCSDGAS